MVERPVFLKRFVPAVASQRRSQILSLLLKMVMIIAVPLSLLHLLVDPSHPMAVYRVLYSAALTALAAGLYALNARGYSQLTGWLLTTLATAAIFIWMAVSGARTGSHTLYYLIAPVVIISLLLSLSAGVRLLAIYIGLLLLFPWQTFGISFIQIVNGPLVFNLFLGGVALLVIGYYKMVEAQRTAELAEREALYRTLVENLRDIVYTHTAEGVVTSVNGVAETLLGYPREQLIGQRIEYFIHPDDLPTARAIFRQMLHHQSVPVFELRLRHANGDYVCVEIKAAPIVEQGRLVFISGIAADVTARKQMESALRESEERYRIVSEMMSDYAYAVQVGANGELRIEWLTDSFSQATGYEVSHAQDLMNFSSYHPDDVARARADVEQVLQGKTVSGEYRGFTKEGRLRWMHVLRRPVWDETQGRVVRFYAMSQDITKRKEADADKLRLALQRERVVTVGQFVRAISHEFRNTLTNIENNRYLVEQMLGAPERQRVQPKLERIRQSVMRLKNQLANLDTVSAVTNPLTVLSDLNALIERLLVEMTPDVQRKGIKLKFEHPPTLPAITINPDEIQRALRHLLANAITHTLPDGCVTISTEQCDSGIIIRVSDTGTGIPTEQQERVFELFYRTDAARTLEFGGMGVGLSIVKLIIEAHGGQIAMESTVGQGTTFVLTLPLADTAT